MRHQYPTILLISFNFIPRLYLRRYCFISPFAHFVVLEVFKSHAIIGLLCDVFHLVLQKMGRIDDAVPVFGQRFNEIYPLIMVIYTLLVASNFFDRIFNYFGSWKRFRFQTESEDTDGFDPSGLMILKKGKKPIMIFFCIER